MVTVGLRKKWAEIDLETWRFDDKIGRPIVFSPASSSSIPREFLYPA
jgi:hypothetical protein